MFCLMKTWCHWRAKEVKRQPRAVTRPPATATSRVDFLLPHVAVLRQVTVLRLVV